jgi:hypothetical protein
LLRAICAENNAHLFDYHIPVADPPNFWAEARARLHSPDFMGFSGAAGED